MLVFIDPFIEVTLPFEMQMFFLPQKLGGFLLFFFFRYQAMADKIHNKIKTIKLATSTGPANSSGTTTAWGCLSRCLLKNLRQTAPRFEDVEAEMLTTYLWDSRYNLLINCIMNLLLTSNMKQASEQVYDLYIIYIHFTDHVYLCQNTFRDQEC